MTPHATKEGSTTTTAPSSSTDTTEHHPITIPSASGALHVLQSIDKEHSNLLLSARVGCDEAQMARRNAARIRRLYGLGADESYEMAYASLDHTALNTVVSMQETQHQQPMEFMQCKRSHAEEVLILTAQVSELRQMCSDEANKCSVIESALIKEQKQVHELQEALNIMCETGENSKLVQELQHEIEALKEEILLERKRADEADIDALEAVQLTEFCVQEKERIEGELHHAWMEIEKLQLELRQRQELSLMNDKVELINPLNRQNMINDEHNRTDIIHDEMLNNEYGHESAPQSIEEDERMGKTVINEDTSFSLLPHPESISNDKKEVSEGICDFSTVPSPVAMPPPPPRPPKIDPSQREITDDSVIGHSFIGDDDVSACRMFQNGVESMPSSPLHQRRIWPDDSSTVDPNMMSPISVETGGATFNSVMYANENKSRPARAMVSSGRDLLKKFKRVTA